MALCAKASHAVLLCHMEQGETVSWAEKIIRSKEQMSPISGRQTNNGGQKSLKQGQTHKKITNSVPCVYFNESLCTKASLAQGCIWHARGYFTA